jgi:class 3 adenylate cyclase
VDSPKTRYAQSADGTYIAYMVFGSGPDLLVTWPWISHLELYWEDPDVGPWLRSLARFARVITLDQRGIGLSDRMTQVIDLETKVDDVRAVLDAAGSTRTTLYGQGVDGGAICSMFAATYPERTLGLLLWSGMPCGGHEPDYPWSITRKFGDNSVRLIAETWGDEDAVAALLSDSGLTSILDDPAACRRWARLMRNAASRGDALVHERVFQGTDFRPILPSIHVPTVILHRQDDWMQSAEWMITQIPGARLVRLPEDRDFPPFLGDTANNLRAVEEFLATIHQEQAELDRVLATVLFTDIVDSTATAAVMGDAKWRALVDEHDRIAKGLIGRYRGEYRKSTGDGLMATFDGPARAVRCAQAFVEAVKPLGIEVRTGAHTGEVTFGDNDLAGIGVHVAARVAGLAGTSEVWASSTVKDLTAGSGLTFEDAGEHELKGVPDRWRLYRVVS